MFSSCLLNKCNSTQFDITVPKVLPGDEREGCGVRQSAREESEGECGVTISVPSGICKILHIEVIGSIDVLVFHVFDKEVISPIGVSIVCKPDNLVAEGIGQIGCEHRVLCYRPVAGLVRRFLLFHAAEVVDQQDDIRVAWRPSCSRHEGWRRIAYHPSCSSNLF